MDFLLVMLGDEVTSLFPRVVVCLIAVRDVWMHVTCKNVYESIPATLKSESQELIRDPCWKCAGSYIESKRATVDVEPAIKPLQFFLSLLITGNIINKLCRRKNIMSENLRIRRTFKMECKWRQQPPNMNNNTGSNLCSQYLPLQTGCKTKPARPTATIGRIYLYSHGWWKLWFQSSIGFLERSHDDIFTLTWLWLILIPFTYKQYTYIYYTYFKQKLPTGIFFDS